MNGICVSYNHWTKTDNLLFFNSIYLQVSNILLHTHRLDLSRPLCLFLGANIKKSFLFPSKVYLNTLMGLICADSSFCYDDYVIVGLTRNPPFIQLKIKL